MNHASLMPAGGGEACTDDPEANQQVGDVGSVSNLSAAQVAQQLCDGVTDASRGVLLCERLQSLWSQQCDRFGTIKNVEFEFDGSDEMTVHGYLESFSFDLEFLTSA